MIQKEFECIPNNEAVKSMLKDNIKKEVCFVSIDIPGGAGKIRLLNMLTSVMKKEGRRVVVRSYNEISRFGNND